MKHLFTAFFWLFNLTLLAIVYLGVLPFFGLALLNDATTGQVPLNFLVTFVGLVGVPTIGSIVGFRIQLRQPVTLFELFYGVEAPLLIICMARFFWLRDLTLPTTFLLMTLLLGTIVTGHWLLSRQENLMRVSLWHLAGQVLVLAIALYFTAILSFYVPPTLVMLLVALPSVLPLRIDHAALDACGRWFMHTTPWRVGDVWAIAAQYLEATGHSLWHLAGRGIYGNRFRPWVRSLFANTATAANCRLSSAKLSPKN
jgi:hypothetical protein